MGAETRESFGSINLAPAIRSSLQAKLERLLSLPIIAAVSQERGDEDPSSSCPDIFRALQRAAQDSQPAVGRSGLGDAWAENPEDGTCRDRVEIDYDDLWRGDEKEILETVRNTVESPVTLLTTAQRDLLERLTFPPKTGPVPEWYFGPDQGSVTRQMENTFRWGASGNGSVDTGDPSWGIQVSELPTWSATEPESMR